MNRFTGLLLATTTWLLLGLLLAGCVSPTPAPNQAATPKPAASPAKESASANQSTIPIPPPPELKEVTVDSKTTALLVLDMQKNTCSPERRPTCVDSIPKVKALLDQARASQMLVVYSLTKGSQPSDIVSELAPTGGEPLVVSGPDKFVGTDLESILKGKNISQVIVTGTAANGAGLHTAAGAAFRGFKAVVPVDGISEEAFAHYYTVWHLANAPGLRDQTVISRSDMIRVGR